MPLAGDVDIDYLAETYELCGREIKNVIKSACVAVALKKREIVSQQDFIHGSISEEKKEQLKALMQKKLDKEHDGIIVP